MKWLLWIPAYAIAGLLVAIVGLAVVMLYPFALASFTLDWKDQLKYYPLMKRYRKQKSKALRK